MSGQRFNLLPHRQMSQDRLRKILWRQITVASAAAIVLALLGQGWLHLRLAYEREEGQTLNAAIEALLADYRQAAHLQQRYTQLLQRQRLIESLDARRSTSVLLLADVAEAMPDQVYLTRLEEDGAQFSVEGRAVDSTDIARFLEKLSASMHLADVVLNEIRAQEQDVAAAFQYSIGARVKLASPMPSENEAAKAQP